MGDGVECLGTWVREMMYIFVYIMMECSFQFISCASLNGIFSSTAVHVPVDNSNGHFHLLRVLKEL